MSDQVNSESTWGPCESASRDKRLAQPYPRRRTSLSGSGGSLTRQLPDGVMTSKSKGVVRLRGFLIA